jgi:hypothetical protein
LSAFPECARIRQGSVLAPRSAASSRGKGVVAVPLRLAPLEGSCHNG